MQLMCNGRTGTHLGYCTNIHAGERWVDLFPQLQRHVPQIKQRVSPDAPFGLGLRASMESISGLQQTANLERFTQWLSDEEIYVFTVNGFPYGAFHGRQVKADVYRPDWSCEERLSYTCAIADVLAALGPPDNFGSISTVPGTFRDWAGAETRTAIIRNLLRCVAHCKMLAQCTGITISVALEPEPACLLETVDDVLSFFQEALYAHSSVKQLAQLANCSESDAELALRTHIGICYDICHAAVEFEDPLTGIERMQSAGIPINKLQLSSALRLPIVNKVSLTALENFDEPVYLHQVVESRNGKLTRFHDLPLAMQAHARTASDTASEKEWRVHFHIPIFLENLDTFGTTQQELSRVLAAHARSPIAPHLEVETYTWDVLPEQYRSVSVEQAIARELEWVKEGLVLPLSSDAAA